MKRSIVGALIAVSLLFSGCTRTVEDRNGNESRSSENANSDGQLRKNRFESTNFADPNPTIITISLSGLMVFQEEKSGSGGYEVGILRVPAGHHKHEFKVTFDGNLESLPGKHWWIEVVTDPPLPGPPPARIPPRNVGFPKRRPDSMNAQNDLDWMIVFGGAEFHQGEDLTMAKNKLNPIIHLPNAELYTLYKSYDLERCQGGRGCVGAPGVPIGGGDPRTEFGFVSEMIAMDIILRPNQKVMLRDDIGTNKELMRYPAPGAHEIVISNIRNPPREDSDFQLYYQLFDQIDAGRRYDFDLTNRVTNGPRYFPYNRPPKTSIRTCCMIDCSAVRLINNPKSLE